MADINKYSLNDELLSKISGGKLPLGWKFLVDSQFPAYKEQYGDMTYEEAKNILRMFVTDEDDFNEIAEYAKKFFTEDGQLK